MGGFVSYGANAAMLNLFDMIDMRITRFWIAAAIIVLVAIVVVVPGFEWGKPGERDFRIDREEVPVRVKMKKQGQEAVVLEKDAAGHWFVDAMQMADERAVEELLAALRFMEVRRPLPSEERQQAIQKLGKQGTRVQVYVRRHWLNFPGGLKLLPRQQLLRDYLILPGDDADAVAIMQMSHAEMPYEMHLPGLSVDLHEVFVPEAVVWHTSRVVMLRPSEITEVRATVHHRQSESYSWRLNGEEEPLLFNHTGERIPREQINTDQLPAYFHQIRRLRYERILPGTAGQPPADLLTGEAFFTLSIKDLYGDRTKMDFFKRLPPDDGTLIPEEPDFDPNRLYLQVNGGDYALAQYVIFHPMIRPLSWFFKNADHSCPFFE